MKIASDFTLEMEISSYIMHAKESKDIYTSLLALIESL